MQYDLRAIGAQFQIFGEQTHWEPYGTGHIHDTFAATYNQGGTRIRYVHQRINHHVFKNPPLVMDNIRRVTTHMAQKLAAAGTTDLTRHTLTVVPTRDGASYHHDADGNYWRTYVMVERGRTFDVIATPQHAYEGAKAFGEFQELLTDLPMPRLHETIPDFHHTPTRYAALERAIATDPRNRAHTVKKEIAFAQQRKPITRVLTDLQERGELPERITHNDTKMNNVIFDETSLASICVTDLDTVMPGLVLYDFGDMVRTATVSTAEDETDLSKVAMRLDLFEAVLRGYLASAGGFLTKTERDYLAFSGKLITFEIGTRFLTDFLEGDHYFKVHHPTHNLDRCRAQYALVTAIEREENALQALVAAV
jgi:hypothetical protein